MVHPNKDIFFGSDFGIESQNEVWDYDRAWLPLRDSLPLQMPRQNEGGFPKLEGL